MAPVYLFIRARRRPAPMGRACVVRGRSGPDRAWVPKRERGVGPPGQGRPHCWPKAWSRDRVAWLRHAGLPAQISAPGRRRRAEAAVRAARDPEGRPRTRRDGRPSPVLWSTACARETKTAASTRRRSRRRVRREFRPKLTLFLRHPTPLSSSSVKVTPLTEALRFVPINSNKIHPTLQYTR
jgi:hypothetical protein